MKQSNLEKCRGYAWSFVVVLVVLTIVSMVAEMASAAPVCNSRVCVKQAAVIQQVAAYPPILYKVGQPLQEEAAATLQFRHSEEYIELQQLRGFKAGVDAVTSSVARGSSPPTAVDGESPAAVEGPTTPPAEAPPVSDFAGRYPTLAANCSRCHTGTEPKGDVWIDGTTPLDGPDAAPKRDAIAAAIINERMPKGKPLDPQTQYDAIIELFRESE